MRGLTELRRPRGLKWFEGAEGVGGAEGVEGPEARQVTCPHRTLPLLLLVPVPLELRIKV